MAVVRSRIVSGRVLMRDGIESRAKAVNMKHVVKLSNSGRESMSFLLEKLWGLVADGPKVSDR